MRMATAVASDIKWDNDNALMPMGLHADDGSGVSRCKKYCNWYVFAFALACVYGSLLIHLVVREQHLSNRNGAGKTVPLDDCLKAFEDALERKDAEHGIEVAGLMKELQQLREKSLVNAPGRSEINLTAAASSQPTDSRVVFLPDELSQEQERPKPACRPKPVAFEPEYYGNGEAPPYVDPTTSPAWTAVRNMWSHELSRSRQGKALRAAGGQWLPSPHHSWGIFNVTLSIPAKPLNVKGALVTLSNHDFNRMWPTLYDWINKLAYATPLKMYFFQQFLVGQSLDFLRRCINRSNTTGKVAVRQLQAEESNALCDITVVPVWAQSNQDGIQHMNTFFGHDMYFHPMLVEYQWIVRLDTDCEILDRIEYNFLEVMEENNFVVGFANLGMPEIAADGMAVAHDKQADIALLRSGSLPFSRDWFGPFGFHDTIFAGPLEVYRMELFRSSLYDSWFHTTKVDVNLGLRFREQYFKSKFIRLYVAPAQIHWFCDFHTKHKVEFAPRCGLTLVQRISHCGN